MTDVALYMLDEDYGSWPVPIFGGPYDYLVRVHTTRKRGRVVPKLDALAERGNPRVRIPRFTHSHLVALALDAIGRQSGTPYKRVRHRSLRDMIGVVRDVVGRVAQPCTGPRPASLMHASNRVDAPSRR